MEMNQALKVIILTSFVIILMISIQQFRDYLQKEPPSHDAKVQKKIAPTSTSSKPQPTIEGSLKAYHQRKQELNIKAPPRLSQEKQELLYRRGHLIDEITDTFRNDDHLSEEELTQILKKALVIIPKKAEIQQLSAQQVHTIPHEVALAGEFFAELKELLSKRADLEVPAFNYYRQCAQSDDYVDSIRALCLTNMIIINSTNQQTELDLSDYPENIINLAQAALEF